MAQRRMFSLTVVDTDNFLDMPQSTQNLYFHLGMRADDDGFVSSPRKIIKIVGAGNDDLKLLASKGYIIPFESGVCVITDWNQNNYIQKDRYHETIYTSEKSLLQKDSQGVYRLCIHDVYAMDTQVRLGKSSLELGKDSLGDHLPGAETVPDQNRNSQPNSAMTELPMVERAVIELPLNDGTMYAVFQANVNRWAELYPAVDIMQQLRAMVGWCEANPTKRKTKRGINKFINSWLMREQDRGGRNGSKPNGGSSTNHGNGSPDSQGQGNSGRNQPRYGHIAGTNFSDEDQGFK